MNHLRNEDQITAKLLGQASYLPGDSRDGYPNLFISHFSAGRRVFTTHLSGADSLQ